MLRRQLTSGVGTPMAVQVIVKTAPTSSTTIGVGGTVMNGGAMEKNKEHDFLVDTYFSLLRNINSVPAYLQKIIFSTYETRDGKNCLLACFCRFYKQLCCPF